MSGNTPWINEGSLRQRFHMEGDQLVRELNQPDRDLIMDSVQDQRRRQERHPLLGGWKVATIPLVDLERGKLSYPDLFDRSADADTRRKALLRFSQDLEMRQYRVRAA